MDVFQNAVIKIMARGLDMAKVRAKVLCALGFYVEFSFEDVSSANPGVTTVEEYGKDARRLSVFVCSEELLSDRYFLLSLRLGFLSYFMKNQEDFKTLFLKHLYEVFSQGVADELYKHALGALQDDAKAKRDLFPSDAEVQDLRQHQRSMLNLGNSYQEKTKPSQFQGTATYLLKCRQCGAQKRCDPRTKNFACKTCGNANVRSKPDP